MIYDYDTKILLVVMIYDYFTITLLIIEKKRKKENRKINNNLVYI